MAGKTTGFITGAHAKLQIDTGDGKPLTVAFVNDLSYAIDTVTAPVESFGRYEVHANEPIAYGISGTFSVLRWTKGAITAAKTDKNGVELSINPGAPGGIGALGTGMHNHLNPQMMLLASTFDLTVSVKKASTANTAEDVAFFKLIDCKITGRRASLNKRGVLIDQYSFVGILATDIDGGIQVATSGNTDLK